MMEQWLDTSELVVIDNNRLFFLKSNSETADLPLMIESKLLSDYKLILTPNNVWPENLRFYKRSLERR